MTAVLLSSRRTGETGWVTVRQLRKARVSGVEEGDALLLRFLPEGELSVDEDGIFPLPQGVVRVRVSHYSEVTLRENGGVSVDLVR